MIGLFLAAMLALQEPAPADVVARIAPVREAIALESARQAALPTPVDDSERLVRLGQSDRAARSAMQAFMSSVPRAERPALRRPVWDIVKGVDQSNQAALLAMVPSEGWFLRSRYGAEASSSAFLIVQHSNADLWRRFLPIMRPLIATGEINGLEYAEMFDRLRMSDHQPQYYATQVSCPYGSNVWSTGEIEDEAHVDERRAALGIEPLEAQMKPYRDDPPAFC